MSVIPSRPDDEGIIWFRDRKNNAVIGYVNDAGVLYAMQRGYAYKVGNVDSVVEAAKHVEAYYVPVDDIVGFNVYKNGELVKQLSAPKIENRSGYVTEPKSTENKEHIRVPFSYGKPEGINETALIGFLAAKLATYEPDSKEVKQAMEYLKCRT